MNVKRTDRGFERVNFEDAYGKECSLQASSAIGDYDDSVDRPGTSFVWLGINEPVPRVMSAGEGWKDLPLPEGVLLAGRMHLSREQVQELLVHLTAWLATGSLSPEEGVSL